MYICVSIYIYIVHDGTRYLRRKHALQKEAWPWSRLDWGHLDISEVVQPVCLSNDTRCFWLIWSVPLCGKCDKREIAYGFPPSLNSCRRPSLARVAMLFIFTHLGVYVCGRVDLLGGNP